MITKNSLVTRDIDLLKDLAQDNLGACHTFPSPRWTKTCDASMEPRTASAVKRLQTVEALAKGRCAGRHYECADHTRVLIITRFRRVLKAAADHGAQSVGMTIVRLNGSIGGIFEDWLRKNFPDRFDKVWNQICAMHGGNVNDSQFWPAYGRRRQSC